MRTFIFFFLALAASGAAACPLMTNTSYLPPASYARAAQVCADQKVDFNATTSEKDSIFRRIVVLGDSVQAVEIGLAAGGDPNITSRRGSPAFVDLINFTDPSNEAVVVEILNLLGAAGANFSTPDDYGDLALSKAAGKGEYDAVQALLSWGADPNGFDTYNRTPLFQTVFGRCSPNIGQILIANGAQISVMQQDQIDRMFAEASESCSDVQGGQAYVENLKALYLQ